ncbi:MAG: MFS transporter [Rhodospirillales bacterium]|nr:MFS transporter [Rhodospirillales bacterium]
MARPQGFGAFRHRSFAFYWFSRVLAVFAIEMQVTTIGWQVYGLTGRALDLGLIGLAQFAPFAALFLVTGLVADRYSRVRILAFCVIIQTACAITLLWLTQSATIAFGPILGVLVLFGIARAFQVPCLQSVVPNLVPNEVFANAVAWVSTGNQISRIGGPTIAGILIAVAEAADAGLSPVYVTVTLMLFAASILTFMIRPTGQKLNKDPMSLGMLVAGLHFIWTRQIIFAAVALDLFAVLFGGAVALLPIYAKDILDVGAEGFGILRSAFMVGAFTGALILTQRPVARRAGFKLLASTGIFGLGVIIFGASETFWISLIALAAMGVSDVVSVFIRHNLVQLITPDDMRGRVGAVVGVFVGASNELGEFESGVTAHWWGTVPAVIAGGAATLAVACAFTWAIPALRRIGSLDADHLVRNYRKPHGRKAGNSSD